MDENVIIINDDMGIDVITETPYNGEQIRRAYGSFPWPNDQEINSIKSENEDEEEDEHQMVDLGLSVKWATCNIGANSPEEAGLYFAWGETKGSTAEQIGNEEGKRVFDWEHYKFGENLSTYNETDEKTELDSEGDAATANWGEGWRMPTLDEFSELMELPHTWDASRHGFSFTDANNNELLFLFAAGEASNGGISGLDTQGYYLSNSVYNQKGYVNYRTAMYFLFNSNNTCDLGGSYRYKGYPVRPVHI